MTNIEREKQIVKQMVEIYCHHHHHEKGLCTECQELLDYAQDKLDHCNFGNNKPACRECPIRCFESHMRKAMRRVKKFSTPRLFFIHPIETIRFLMQQ